MSIVRPHSNLDGISQNVIRRSCFFLFCWLLSLTSTLSQVNLVPNHSFEEISDCYLEFGDIPKAPPWQIVPEPENTPDLYHYCSTSSFYSLPAGCNQIDPKYGEGMIGQAQNIPPEERVFVRLTDTLPLDMDIYVAFSTITEPKCSLPPILLCYSNTQCLAFSDFAFQNLNVVLEPDTIITNGLEWTTLRNCYRANGSEDYVLLGNYRLGSETQLDCDTISFLNYSYYYFDEVIVSPFDVVPDTLIICGDEILEIDASFYDLPIGWSDGVQGAVRTIDEAGRLIALGNTGDCLLHDTTYIIRIPDEQETIPLAICEGEELLLQSPIPAIWPNGDTSSTFLISQAGSYQAILLADCDEKIRSYLYEVTDEACDITYFVPNAFSPNRDGINDQLRFFFDSEFDFSGDLHIFDRWGNLLFQMKVDQSTPAIRWDGTFKGKVLGAGVYVWAYQYVSGKDDKTRLISGDVTKLP